MFELLRTVAPAVEELIARLQVRSRPLHVLCACTSRPPAGTVGRTRRGLRWVWSLRGRGLSAFRGKLLGGGGGAFRYSAGKVAERVEVVVGWGWG